MCFNSTISFHSRIVVERLISVVNSLNWQYVFSCPSDLNCAAMGSSPAYLNLFTSTTYAKNGAVFGGHYARDNYHWQRPALIIYFLNQSKNFGSNDIRGSYDRSAAMVYMTKKTPNSVIMMDTPIPKPCRKSYKEEAPSYDGTGNLPKTMRNIPIKIFF